MTTKAKINFTAAQLAKSLKTTAPILKEIGTFWVKRIYAFTKLGKSLATGAKFAPLKPSYVSARRKYEGAKGELFGPKKSNLTLTGQMLNSMGTTESFATQRVFLRLVGIREDGITNSDLARWMEEGDSSRNREPRPFLGLDATGEKRIAQMVLRGIRRSYQRRKPGILP